MLGRRILLVCLGEEQGDGRALVMDLESFVLRRGNARGGVGMMLCLLMRMGLRVFVRGKRLLNCHGARYGRGSNRYIGE